MDAYRWHDAAKEKPEDSRDVLICFSGKAGRIQYKYCYSVGCCLAKDGKWELQEYGGAPMKGIRVHGWKEIEPFKFELED